ncbi:hypothetical protein PS723_04778 [Pseudomonas fluorescens]|uniref:Uncharacterized protein n=1 Tax=Pseudomonas fluorescens TaxID=294 RepID=A0A5E7EPK7_PSEFL|nr:hypothetical protein PS723_04778 [Pseudomonas fluorescens]
MSTRSRTIQHAVLDFQVDQPLGRQSINLHLHLHLHLRCED